MRSSTVLLKSFQFLSSLEIPDSNSTIVWEEFNGKTVNNSAIAYSSDHSKRVYFEDFLAKFMPFSKFSLFKAKVQQIEAAMMLLEPQLLVHFASTVVIIFFLGDQIKLSLVGDL